MRTEYQIWFASSKNHFPLRMRQKTRRNETRSSENDRKWYHQLPDAQLPSIAIQSSATAID